MAVEGKVEGRNWTNEWLLSTFVLFFTFLAKKSIKKKKGKKLRTNCPEQSTDNLQSGSVTQIYITYLLAEF